MKKVAFPLLASSFLFFSCSPKQAASLDERLAWQNATLVKAYDTVGRRNAKWDEPARKALSEFAKTRAGKTDVNIGTAATGDLVQTAVLAGCDDPMIRYLYCRWAPDHAAKSLVARQDDYRKMALDMESSGYAPLLKFYANDRTADILWQNQDHNLWQEVVRFRRAGMNDLAAALQDKSLPIQDIAEACDVLVDTISANTQEMTDAYTAIEGPLFRNWPQTSAAYFVKGKFYYRFAWIARGSGYADKVTDESWKGFKEKLAVAEAAYQKAWSLNPKDVRIPTEMIEMAVSQQKDRAEMELWFQRGMKLNTNNYEVCVKKLRYLMPQWYGSDAEMVAFGRECVASKWGGRVPLILVEAHYHCAEYLDQKEQNAYWRQPEVWPDIQSAYEKFFEVNPNASNQFRYYYARYAFACGQWHPFNEQIKLIGDHDGSVDAAFFGGDDKLKKMVETAKAGDSL